MMTIMNIKHFKMKLSQNYYIKKYDQLSKEDIVKRLPDTMA